MSVCHCTQVCFGSVGEVRRFEEYLYGNSPRFSTANELEVRGFCGFFGGGEGEGGLGCVGWSCLMSLAHTPTQLCVHQSVGQLWLLPCPQLMAAASADSQADGHRFLCPDAFDLDQAVLESKHCHVQLHTC